MSCLCNIPGVFDFYASAPPPKTQTIEPHRRGLSQRILKRNSAVAVPSTPQVVQSDHEEIPSDPPLLRGNDPIRMGYSRGPLFSEILTAVEDAQLDGTISTREEAERLVTDKSPRA